MRKRTLRGAVACAAALLSLAFATTASADTFVVLYKSNAVPASANSDIQKAGGTYVYGYGQIGVAIARSDSASFASTLSKDSRVEGVSTTRGFGSKLGEPAAEDSDGPPAGDLPNSPATDADTFSPLQWDMRQIHAPEAHETTGGSPSVVVGDIDTGIDAAHPDLRENVSDADSAD